MDRVALKNLTHNAKDFLNVRKSDYKQWVFRYTFLELEKDLGVAGDITSRAVLGEAGSKPGTGTVYAQEDGVVAGLDEIMYFLVESDPRFRPRLGAFEVELFVKDGASVKAGDKVMSLSGSVQDILAVERVVLNLLMRMSGVASYTRELVGQLEAEGLDTLIVPTRKTLWGLLDKKAVVLGGGGTHRLNLADAVMIKDNHLKVLGGSVVGALKGVADSEVCGRFVEIEVEDADSAVKAAEGLNGMKLESPACVLFDNMKASEIESALVTLKEKGLYDGILFEASGGISDENFIEYARTGVDIVSMGCLTMGVSGMDFSLDL
jgi:nicotinate-nucleotide pyrophosphorylase (carboxylating)